jgi:subtilisin family serine protease
MAIAACLVAGSVLAGSVGAARGPADGTPAIGIEQDTGSAIDRVSDVVPGEAIVRFKPGTTPDERRAARREVGTAFDRSLRVAQAQLVEVEGSVTSAIRRLERQPAVAYAQPNYVYRASVADPPDDTFFGDLWGLEGSDLPNPGVGALEAWDESRGAGQVIAVIDTGVALDHPDLAGNLWSNPGETPGGGDDDSNGHGDDIHGYDFVDGDADPDDYNFHGTHVAGTAAAVAGNGIGIAGVAPDAEVMAVRVLDGDGIGSSEGIGAGIRYATLEGADVINMSLGGGSTAKDHFMSDAIDLAAANEVVVVVAAGNDSADNDVEPTVPCTFPQANLVCIAAIDESGAIAGFSNRGATTVDIGAPGVHVLSAKTDYATLYSESFGFGLGAWTTFTDNGGLNWGGHPAGVDGNASATDSPGGSYGNALDPDESAESQLVKTTPLSLVARRGCRMHFALGYEIEEGFDELVAGAVGVEQDTLSFTGSTGGAFEATEVSISDLDEEASVKPAFALFSDESVADDGAYVDALRVLCRDSTYLDDKTTVGNYVPFSGTSMATPHVAGIAALVRSAAPGLSAVQTVEVIEQGGVPLASLGGKTATGCTANASGAIAIALGGSDPGRCPSPPAPVPPTPTSTSIGTSTTTLPSPLRKPNLRRSKRTVRVSKRRSFAYSFSATPGLRGRVVIQTANRVAAFGVRLRRRVRLTIARKPFVVSPNGRVRLRIRLSRKEMRILRRNRRLALRVRVTVRDSGGRLATARKRLLLLPPRDRRPA